MRFVRADIPDAGILRSHHRQTRFERSGVKLVGNIYRIQRMFHRHADHGICQPLNVVHITRDRGIAEIEIQHVRQLVKVAFIDAFVAQQREITENGRNDVVPVSQPFIGQRRGDGQHAAIPIYNGIGVSANTFHQPLLLQPVGERTRAAVADKIRHQLVGFAAELRRVVINTEFNA